MNPKATCSFRESDCCCEHNNTCIFRAHWLETQRARNAKPEIVGPVVRGEPCRECLHWNEHYDLDEYESSAYCLTPSYCWREWHFLTSAPGLSDCAQDAASNMVQNPTPGAAASTTMATTRPTVVHPIFTAFQHWARTRTVAALRKNTAAQHSATQQVQLCKAELASVQSQNARGRAMAENAACRTLRTEMAAWSDKVTTCEQTGQRLTLQLFRRALRTSPGVPAQADPAGLRLFGELNWDNICAANPGIAAPAAVKVLRVMWQAFPAANRHKYQIKA